MIQACKLFPTPSQKYIYLFFVLSFFCGSAFAQDVSTAPPSPSFMLAKVFIVLVLTVIFILGAAKFAKRFNLGGIMPQGDVKVLATLPVSARERVLLIDAAGQKLLIGVAPGRINTLHTYEPSEQNSLESDTQSQNTLNDMEQNNSQVDEKAFRDNHPIASTFYDQFTRITGTKKTESND